MARNREYKTVGVRLNHEEAARLEKIRVRMKKKWYEYGYSVTNSEVMREGLKELEKKFFNEENDK